MLEELSNYIYNSIYPKVNKIADRLWLGNSMSPLDADFMYSNNINVLVNCTPDLPFGNYTENVKAFRIPVHDSLLEKDLLLMENYFSLLIPQLVTLYNQHSSNILIFCRMGKQRSAIFMAALLYTLVNQNKFTLPKNNSTVFQYILSKRPQAFTHGYRINFKKSFDRYFSL